MITSSGQYRQPYRDTATRSGFKVSLYRLGCRVQALRYFPSKAKHPVGKRASVKANPRRRWWQHPQGCRRPQFTRAVLARMLAEDELYRGRGRSTA